MTDLSPVSKRGEQPNVGRDNLCLEGVTDLSHTKETLTKERKKPTVSPELERSFEAFWTAYPNKKGKKKAFDKWKKLAPDNGLTEQIMEGLSKVKRSRQWTKDDGQFIPHPVTWLNGERWNDEGEATTTRAMDF